MFLLKTGTLSRRAVLRVLQYTGPALLASVTPGLERRPFYAHADAMYCLLDLGPALAIDNFPHAVHRRGMPVKGVDDPAFVRSVAGVDAVQYRLDRPELVVSSGLQKRQSIQVRGSSSILADTCISSSSIDDKALCCSPRWFGSRLKLPKGMQ